MRIITYGLTEEIPGQLGMTVGETGRYLRDLGITGVFLKQMESDWCLSLQQAGLEVYASHGIFVDNDDLWREMPESRPLTAAGEPAPVEDWYSPVLPSLPAVRAFRLRQIDALLSDLPLDGLWLDFIRWPARWERRHPHLYHSSFDPITLRHFQSDTAIEVKADLSDPSAAAARILANDAEAWYAWRCRLIAEFVDDVRHLLRRHRPDAILGAFTVPWTGEPLDDLPVSQAHERIVGQDPALLGPRADVLSPMVYHRLCGRDLDWPRHVTSALHKQVACQVWPTVEAIADDIGYSADEFSSVCDSVQSAGSGGLIVFNLAGLLADNHKLELLGCLAGSADSQR